MTQRGNPNRGYRGRFTSGTNDSFSIDSSKVSPEIRKAMNEVKKLMRKQGAHQKSYNKKYIKKILRGK